MFGTQTRRRGMFGGGASLVATPEQEAESERLNTMFGMGAPAQPSIGEVAEVPPVAQAKRKVNWGGVAADFLSGLAGQRGQYLASIQAEQKRADEAREYQRQRMDKREDWMWQQQNRANDTEQDFEFWKSRLTPEQFETWKANKINPPVWRQDYATGQWMRVDPSAGGGAAPKVIGPQLDDDWELEGGGVGNGPGGFPRR